MHTLRNGSSRLCRCTVILLFVSIVVGSFVGHGAAQQPSITYVYDDLGRLVRVITAGGEAATYHYDAVGNILRITRETGVAASASVINLSASSGVRGTSLLLAITTCADAVIWP